MNDIKWHYNTDEDFHDLLMDFKPHEILIQTNIATRISNTVYFSDYDERMVDCNEKLIKFAFMED